MPCSRDYERCVTQSDSEDYTNYPIDHPDIPLHHDPHSQRDLASE